MTKDRAMAQKFSQMGIDTKGNLKTRNLTDSADTFGQIKTNMKETG